MNQKKRFRGLGILLAVAALFAAQGAQADTLSLNDWAVTSGSTPAFYISAPSEGVSEGAYAGGFSGVYTSGASSTSFVAYCVDLAQSFNWGSPFTVTPASASSVFSAAQYSALDHLYTQYFPATTDKASSAAFQLAVWAIVSEPGSTYSLSSASFSATAYGLAPGTEAAALATASTWLSTIGSGASGGYNLTVLESPTYQDQLIATPIPEPETYAMLLAGLGPLAFAIRRRKRKQAAAA
jgi:hypothetical protein